MSAKPPKPGNEEARMALLREYQILDTASEQDYDDIVAVAAFICGVPMATISFVDNHRQWFKARIGVKHQETPREVAFCAHTILSDEPMIIRDALEDHRFSESPLVREEPRIRFYAGFPLTSPEGLALGALCAIDSRPRELNEGQTLAMKALSRQVIRIMEMRRLASRMASVLEQIETLEGLLPICAWCKRIRGDDGYWSKLEAYISEHTGADFTHGICPDCLEKERSKISRSNGKPTSRS
jgi:GAF domain-containing protein